MLPFERVRQQSAKVPRARVLLSAACVRRYVRGVGAQCSNA